MKVIFFHRLPHQFEKARVFAAGMQRHGINVEFAYPNSVIDSDLAVFWGHKFGGVMQRQRQAKRPYLVIEAGYIGDRTNDWWSLGFNGLNGRADFGNDDVSGDRFAKHLARYVVPEWNYRKDGYALLMGQVEGDASLDGVDIFAWYRSVRQLHRGSLLRFRPHPLAGFRLPADIPYQPGTLKEALDGARYVITYNSNSGVDAVCQGVPVIAVDRGSMVYSIAGQDLGEPPPAPDIVEWCHKIAYAQWTPYEIERGEAWDHLRHRYETLAADEPHSGADQIAAHAG